MEVARNEAVAVDLDIVRALTRVVHVSGRTIRNQLGMSFLPDNGRPLLCDAPHCVAHVRLPLEAAGHELLPPFPIFPKLRVEFREIDREFIIEVDLKLIPLGTDILVQAG